MVHVDEVGCRELLAQTREERIKYLERGGEQSIAQAGVLRETPIRATPGMLFMAQLNEMADEIRELVLSAKRVVLLDYRERRGDLYTQDHTELTIHPLFEKLGIARADGKNQYEWERDRFLDFKAWMRCCYPRLVSVIQDEPDPEDDHRSDEIWHTVELQRS